ncbi:FHA domain-containing protein [Geodermatophilus sp. CPCC 205506]|uniref:FHA domain-containing protein n=1 Tax=Geodermatophilus sp. CPCC 205506 TaxID=2936596 RepID=UPI003EE955B6
MSVSSGATVPPFDQVGVAIAPGTDLVVRVPGIVLVVAVEATATPAPAVRLGGWAAAPVASPPAVPVGDRRVGELVDLCRRVSAAGSRAPGRRLHEELRGWLASHSEPPSFAVAGATEDGLAIGLAGRGVAEVPDLGLRLTPQDGERLPDGTAFLDRLVDWPPAPLRLTAGAPLEMAPHPLADLMAGTVPGAAAVLTPAPSPAPDAPSHPASVRLPSPAAVPAGPDPAAAGTAMPPVAGTGVPPVPPASLAASAPHEQGPAAQARGPHAASGPDVVVPPPVALPPPLRAVSLSAPSEAEPPRPPLPIVSTEQPPAALVREPEDTRPRAKGFLCENGHLNDPRLPFCALCGVRVVQQSGVLVEGVRPPLGLLLFDNGATVSLDADYLLGREPEIDDRVRSGQLRPLLVVDQTGGVSRRHAEIRLEGWDVVLVDTGSANGTLVAPRGAPAWSSLVPGQPIHLLPGMAVRMGSRQFVFEFPHGGH